MSNIIILKINEKLCGIYNSENLIDIFIKSCLNCNFIKKNDKIKLEYYQINSFILNDTKIINFSDKNFKNIYEDFSDSDNSSYDNNKVNIYDSENSSINANEINDSENSSINANDFLNKKKNEREVLKKIIDIGQEKIDLHSQINKLNLEKKKINEKKIKYEYDIELFNKFKDLREKNLNFEIPDLFINKFNLFTDLEKNNDLNFESFIDSYKDETFKTSYFDLFESQEYAYKLPIPENFNNENIEEIKHVAF